MQETGRVHLADGLVQVARERVQVDRVERALGRDRLLEAEPLHELGGDEREVVLDLGVQHARDAVAAHPVQARDLARQASARVRVGADRGVQELERDGGARGVTRLPHGAHPTAAEARHEGVPTHLVTGAHHGDERIRRRGLGSGRPAAGRARDPHGGRPSAYG
nr:hypothetical protein [Litorihabitans aurantiacus]